MTATTGSDIQVVVVGSVGLDTIETKFERREELLGGSVSYACAGSVLFAPTGMVGVVGSDFPDACRTLYTKLGINLDGLAVVEGKTFRWSGVYDEDMINRTTLSTELNVFENFSPRLPENYRDAPYVLLGNISPDLQLNVLEQTREPRFVVADTMDLWINIAREDLMKVIGRVNMLTLNDSEIRLLTDEHNLRRCAEMVLDMGPEYVVVKKGEHGAMLMTREAMFLVPAYPVPSVVDPTGAGDSFAGGFIGRLASRGSAAVDEVKQALLMGSVVASFGVEAFSLDQLENLTDNDVDARLAELTAMMTI